MIDSVEGVPFPFYSAPDGLQTVIEHLHSELYGRFPDQDQRERRQKGSEVKESERAIENERERCVGNGK